MNTYIKKWAVGLLVGTAGTALVWSDYRAIGLLLAWVGWGVAAYGIGGGIVQRIRQAKNK